MCELALAADTTEAPAAAGSAHDSVLAIERRLARQAALPDVLALARVQSPELVQAEQLARAARERAPAAGRLPDPAFEYQLWAQPLRRPYALDRAEMHMFGVRQELPAPGSLGASQAAAYAEADMARAERRARELDLMANVRRAYAEYHRADRENALHARHVELAEQALGLVRARYLGAEGAQGDVLRAELELARMHEDVIMIARDRAAAAALLNRWMGRDPDAPLGPPEALDAAALATRAAELMPRLRAAPDLDADRPELEAARAAVRAREQELEAARAEQRWPAFMLGLGYMYAPSAPEPHDYGVLVSFNLPWLNPRHGEQVRSAEARAAAQRSALSSARLEARYELREAQEVLRAARASLDIVEQRLLPLAERGVDVARAAFRTGAGALGYLDALRALLDTQIERERALARVENALVDLERALGGPASPGSEQR